METAATTNTGQTVTMGNRRFRDDQGVEWRVFNTERVATRGFWTGMNGSVRTFAVNQVTGEEVEVATGESFRAESAVRAAQANR